MQISLMQYVMLGYVFLSTILGGILAYYKRDFIMRGVAICLFSGVFGLIFMALAPSSKAREGDTSIWPDRAPEATILNLLLFVVVFGIAHLLNG